MVISLMAAIVVDAMVSMMDNDVVDMGVYFGVVFIVAGLCGSSCNLNYLCLVLLHMICRVKVEALCFRLFRRLLPSPTLVTFVGFKW